jgi:ATP-dependent Lon protease
VTPQDFYATGTAVHMHHPVRTEGKIQFIAEGQRRFRIVKWLSKKTPYLAQVEYISDSRGANSDEVKAYAMAIINSIKELLPLNPLYSEELKFFLNRFSPNEPSLLTDFAASLTTASKEKLQDVLEALNLKSFGSDVTAASSSRVDENECASIERSKNCCCDGELKRLNRAWSLASTLSVVQWQ